VQCNNMDFLGRGLTGDDLLEKSHELRAGMASRSFAGEMPFILLDALCAFRSKE
jgi:hypothetical protein